MDQPQMGVTTKPYAASRLSSASTEDERQVVRHVHSTERVHDWCSISSSKVGIGFVGCCMRAAPSRMATRDSFVVWIRASDGAPGAVRRSERYLGLMLFEARHAKKPAATRPADNSSDSGSGSGSEDEHVEAMRLRTDVCIPEGCQVVAVSWMIDFLLQIFREPRTTKGAMACTAHVLSSAI